MNDLTSLYIPGQYKDAARRATMALRPECPTEGVAWN